ncbi:MAG: hypothetical protein NTW86_06675 [Candidatus Sumerlaeota bacterium]|nr:hypothetical protein [Candidatus Sumerlaeota bacterium]
MNRCERYLETILFGTPDRIPFTPGGPRKSTLEVWRRQGLALGRNYMDALRDILGLPGDPPAKRLAAPGASFLMIPQFEEKVLAHENGHYIVQDWKGNVCEISDEFDVTYLRTAADFVTRRWIKLPVESREDWEAMKRRYHPDDSRRYPADFDARCAALRDRDDALRIHVNGPFWQLREWVGAEQLCILFATEQDFVREMIAFWADFVSKVLERILSRVAVDVFSLSEDMAFKGRSFISPAMTREFLLPTYIRWVEQARAGGARVYDMDSDGYIGDLIPIWIDAGINCCNPIEVAAGCDVVEFRRRFGTKMAYHGAMDKRLIARGGEALKNEILRIVPAMLKDGGFIPSCDHAVPPDISWPSFIEYSRQLAQLTGWL